LSSLSLWTAAFLALVVFCFSVRTLRPGFAFGFFFDLAFRAGFLAAPFLRAAVFFAGAFFLGAFSGTPASASL
jgi:hypothetical protein